MIVTVNGSDNNTLKKEKEGRRKRKILMPFLELENKNIR
jgi:hypothetical protein